MSELKSPVQPFIVRHKGALSALQMQSLIQLYQPIIGIDAVNLYLLLFQQPVNEQKISTQKVHSSLFPYVAGSLGKIDDARLHLEAVGLIETYKQTTEGIVYPTLLYDMQYPLLIKDFLENPLLSNALINQLGDLEFFEVVRQWEIAPIEIAEYEEVTVSFETVLSPTYNDYQAQAYEARNGYELQHHDTKAPTQMALDDFDYMKVLRKLMNAQINHLVLGPSVKQQALAIRTVYGFDEEQISQLILQSYDATIPAIQYEELKLAAQKLSESTKAPRTTIESASVITPTGQATKANSSTTTAKGHATSEQTAKSNQNSIAKTTLQTLKDQFPHFTDNEIKIMALCQKVAPEAMLTQLKVNKNGFVSQKELDYIENIKNLSSLPLEVQTYLVYYLIFIENRPEFQKGESERIANLWQQENLNTLEKAMTYVRHQAKERMMKQKQQANRGKGQSYQAYPQRPKKTEVKPYWAQQKSEEVGQQQANQSTPPQPTISQSEEALRSQLGQLFERGRDE